MKDAREYVPDDTRNIHNGKIHFQLPHKKIEFKSSGQTNNNTVSLTNPSSQHTEYLYPTVPVRIDTVNLYLFVLNIFFVTMIQAKQVLATVSVEVVPVIIPHASQRRRLAKAFLFLLTVVFGMYTVLFACKIALENFLLVQPTYSVKQRVDLDIHLTSADLKQFASPDGSVSVKIMIHKGNGPNITSIQRVSKEAIPSLAGVQVGFQGTSMN